MLYSEIVILTPGLPTKTEQVSIASRPASLAYTNCTSKASVTSNDIVISGAISGFVLLKGAVNLYTMTSVSSLVESPLCQIPPAGVE